MAPTTFGTLDSGCVKRFTAQRQKMNIRDLVKRTYLAYFQIMDMAKTDTIFKIKFFFK